jgi:hypothetical protein
MKRLLMLIIMLATACSPLGNPQGLVQSGPTALIDPAYPTLESAPAASVQSSSGFNVVANRAWREGKQVNAEVCFTLPDGSDWSVWGASLQYADVTLFDFSTSLLSIQTPIEGQAGFRCDTLSFQNVPPDADLSSVTISVDSIAAPPRPEEYCTIYMPKIQQSLDERATGILLGCVDSGGVQVMQIISKPDVMSQEEAEQIVYSDEFYTVKGPWSFTFNLGQ